MRYSLMNYGRETPMISRRSADDLGSLQVAAVQGTARTPAVGAAPTRPGAARINMEEVRAIGRNRLDAAARHGTKLVHACSMGSAAAFKRQCQTAMIHTKRARATEAGEDYSRMSHDTLVHRFVRPLVRAVARTKVAPDHLTALRFATALAAAAAFAQGQDGWTGVGAGLFTLSALLDRADGELARLTQRFSQHGHRYDLVADCSAGVMAFIGLGVGAMDGVLGPMALALGMAAGIGIGVLFWEINVAAPGRLPGWTGRDGRVLADPDDGMFALPLLVLCFGAEAVLLPGSIITPAAALWLASRRLRLRTEAGSKREPL